MCSFCDAPDASHGEPGAFRRASPGCLPPLFSQEHHKRADVMLPRRARDAGRPCSACANSEGRPPGSSVDFDQTRFVLRQS